KRKSPTSSSSHKSHHLQVREHLEQSDHLIRITQYMAEVISELEHSSSSSGNEEGVHACLDSTTMGAEDEAVEGSNTDDTDETLQRIAQETAVLQEEYEKRMKFQKRQQLAKPRGYFAVMWMWILPVLLAIFLGWMWKSSQVLEAEQNQR
ncbi:MAG: hypothetical protein SGILL_008577, partial [Bacillariaceae sp.]